MKLSNRALSTGHFLVYPLFLCLLFKYLLTTVLKQHSKIFGQKGITQLNSIIDDVPLKLRVRKT